MWIIKDLAVTILGYLKADWFILLVGILMAVSINVYVDSTKLKNYLEKNKALSIPASVGFGALTPLCACGTMAVLLSMFFSAMPWGPVMAFLVSSPLTSPSDFMFQTAFFGVEFASTVLVSSILLGLAAGFIAHYLDQKTNFFKGQFKLLGNQEATCCDMEGKTNTSVCCGVQEEQISSDCCGVQRKEVDSSCCETQVSSYCSTTIEKNTFRKNSNKGFVRKYKLDYFVKGLYELGLKRILLAFILFISIGRIVEMVIPKEWVMTLFSGNNSYSVPLGASVGLPLYVSGSAALPLMKSFISSGAGEGAIMAFLITGKATGVPVIVGMSTILKKKVILLYISFVYLGGMLIGYLYQLLVNVLS